MWCSANRIWQVGIGFSVSSLSTTLRLDWENGFGEIIQNFLSTYYSALIIPYTQNTQIKYDIVQIQTQW